MSGLRTLLGRDKAVLGLVIVVFGTIVYGLMYTGSVQSLFRSDGRTVKAVFASAPQLAKADPVRLGGVEVGRVKSVKINPGGRSATVEMNVSDNAFPLYRDASAELRWRTLLGANLVVNLRRGSRSKGELGSNVIPQSRTSTQVEFDDLTPIWSGTAKSGFQSMLRELPDAFADHQAPSVALRALGRGGPSIAGGLRAVRGRSTGDLARLVASASRTVTALDTRSQAVHDLVEGGAATTRVTAATAGDIREAVRQAALVLPVVESASARLSATLMRADPLIDRLQHSAGDLEPTLARLQPTLEHADRLLERAEPLLRSLRPAARSLASASKTSLPVLRDVAPGLERLDRKILPDFARRSPESKHATYEMIGPFFASLNAPFASFDKVTHFVRFLASGGADSLDVTPCRSFLTDPTRNDLATCNSIVEALSALFAGGASSRRAGP